MAPLTPFLPTRPPTAQLQGDFAEKVRMEEVEKLLATSPSFSPTSVPTLNEEYEGLCESPSREPRSRIVPRLTPTTPTFVSDE